MMKVLLITNKEDITTDFVVKSLSESKIQFYRFNTDEIGKSISIVLDFEHSNFIISDHALNEEIDLLNIKSVYFRRPELNVIANNLSEGEYNFVRSELYYTLEGIYRILDNAFWLNNVYNIRKAENKLYQLFLAKKIGFDIPASLITNVPSRASSFYFDQKELCIVKPIKSGLIEGKKEEGVIFTSKIDLSKNSVNRISVCPTYFQNLVKKRGDLRVTVVGNSVFTAFIDSQTEEESIIDWRKSTVLLPHSKYQLPEEISGKCLSLMNELGLNFGAIDFIITEENELIFLEINPNGQWAWIEKRLGYPISKEICKLLIEKSVC